MKANLQKEIWVFQTAFVGDCVLSLPFLKELLRLEPNAQIKLVAQKGIQSQMFHLARQRALASDASRLHILEFNKKEFRGWNSWGRTRQWIHSHRDKTSKIEKAFCLQRSFRTALMAMMSGARERIGFSSGSASFFYTEMAPRSWDRGVHEVEKNLDLLRAVYGASNVGTYLGQSLEARPSILARPEADRPQRDRARAAIALGSPWPTKRWPIENALSLCESWIQQGVEVYLMGDPSALELAQYIETRLPSLMIKNYVGKTSASEWVDLLDSVSLLVSGDSASVHVASDLGVPVLALFGPTVPEFGFSPWRSQSKVLQKTMDCRPCHIHGPKECPLGHHKCLKELEADSVLRHAKSYLLVDPHGKKL